MRLNQVTKAAILGFQLLFAVNLCCGQSLSCIEVATISNMAISKSNSSLAIWKKQAGDSYVADLVYSIRSFELNSNDRSAAVHLLSLLPPNKEQASLWDDLDGLLCDEEPIGQVELLAKLHARMSQDIALAVLLVPEKMSDYVSYAYTSIQSPHSDYAVQMHSVCQKRHKAFVAAVDSFTPKDRQWFITKIFDPESCRAIAVPEAD